MQDDQATNAELQEKRRELVQYIEKVEMELAKRRSKLADIMAELKTAQLRQGNSGRVKSLLKGDSAVIAAGAALQVTLLKNIESIQHRQYEAEAEVQRAEQRLKQARQELEQLSRQD